MATSPPAKSPSLGGRVLDRLAARAFAMPRASTGYTVARRVRIPTRDGIELEADHYQPEGQAVGTVLVRGPYGRHMLMALRAARLFAARGYHALYVSCRGTFGSGGAFEPMVHEVADGQDVVAWLRDQPWFTGSFATMGESYLGFTQWALLTDPPPEMVTAVISVAPHDFGRHAWGTGAFRLDFLGWSHMVTHQEDAGVVVGAIRQATAARRHDQAASELPLTRAGQTYLEGRADWYADWVTRPDLNDPFWAPMNLSEALDRAQIPILLISGWQDIFLDQTIEQFEHLHRRGQDVALTVGPWTHLAVGAGAARINGAEAFDWIEEHLAHRGPRVRRAAVHIFVTGADEWRYLPSWPPASSPHVLHLGPHRDLLAEPPPDDAPDVSFLFDPADPTPTVGGPLMTTRFTVDDTSLGERADVATFTTPVQTRDLEVLGRPILELAHTGDSAHADLFARLSEVGADGHSHNVTEGYLRLDPDRRDEPVRLELRSMAHRFKAGTRLRLVVAGGCFPQFARNLGTDDNPGTGTEMRPVRHTISLSQGRRSRLILPVPDP